VNQAGLFDIVEKSAVLSRCEIGKVDAEHDRPACEICNVYRYELRRVWEPSRPLMVWVMLNPSTADAEVDDATVEKCMRFAKAWGYGGMIILNCYALRARHPEELAEHPDPVGPENDAYLERIDPALMVVCAWGATGVRGPEVVAKLIKIGVVPHHLELTRGGQPWHPLFLKETLMPRVLSPELVKPGKWKKPRKKVKA
jgi:hypothetical protein